MANNNSFEWVKPYDATDRPISDGAGYLSGVSEGYPLRWKVLTPNYGRLLRKGRYQFTTNDIDYTGSTSKASITKYATLYQHGQSIFQTGQFNLIEATNSTIIFNLLSDNDSGIIETALNLETNALFFTINIKPAPIGDTWESAGHTFTQVGWVANDILCKDYFNSVRDLTSYEFSVTNNNYSPSTNTYLEGDTDSSYKFKMMYEVNNVKMTTGYETDALDYFGDLLDVKFLDFENLNSTTNQFTDSNGRQITFHDYYSNMLTKGERDIFKYHFYTDVNPLVKGSSPFFDECKESLSTYYIAPNEMLHLTITIKPYGYKVPVNDIRENSPLWNYGQYEINVYIINYAFEPYLYLNTDYSEGTYTSPNIAANGGTQPMPIFSNRGWDITTNGVTDYVGYSTETN